MKHVVFLFAVILLTSSCMVISPTLNVQLGMSEAQFLRRNPSAVVSLLDNDLRVYRLQRDQYFYALATFRNGALLAYEEKELPYRWPTPPAPSFQNQHNHHGGDR